MIIRNRGAITSQDVNASLIAASASCAARAGCPACADRATDTGRATRAGFTAGTQQ